MGQIKKAALVSWGCLMPYNRALCWIRRELRLTDNRALSEATKNCDEVIPVFVFDTNILDQLEDKEDRRVQFIWDSLIEMNQKLHGYGSEILILHGDPAKLIPDVAEKLDVDAIFTTRDYEPAAKERDLKILEHCSKNKTAFLALKDIVIFESAEVAKDDGSMYKVFTPYKKRWLSRLSLLNMRTCTPNLQRLVPREQFQKLQSSVTLSDLGFKRCESEFKPGENAAKKALEDFKLNLSSYHTQRDYPAISEGTSKLSVHLRFGTISIRECVRAARRAKGEGAQVWQSELIWRHFYQMILDTNPHVTDFEFLEKYQSLIWPGEDDHFEAWKDGQTGYPIVDAGMRQLNQTGWMHNRVRMIVASFLVKDLLIDWRRGERYFAEKLIDYDLAANNGGWQWCASTGCDAQPYFRIFNPESQSKKFDPNGDYIRKWVPELMDLGNKQIHAPSKPVSGYPEKIVSHATQRVKAIKLFKGS